MENLHGPNLVSPMEKANHDLRESAGRSKASEGELIKALLRLGRKAHEHHRNSVAHVPIAVAGYDHSRAMHFTITGWREEVETHFFPNGKRLQRRKFDPVFPDTH